MRNCVRFCIACWPAKNSRDRSAWTKLERLHLINQVITAFTLGHSITLLGATLLEITANPFLIDAVIALSVIYKGFENLDGFKKYFARKQDCAACTLKPRCTPNQAARKIARSRHQSARQRARDIARTNAYVASSYARKKVEMLFAHLKRILGLDRLRLRGPTGARDEFHLAAMVQNLRKLAKLVPAPA